MNRDDLPTPLLVASMIGWIWGGGMALLSIAVGIPAVLGGQGLPAAATSLLLSVATLIGARGVGRRRRPWIMLGACLGWLVYLWLVPLRIRVPGVAVNGVILGIVLFNLRSFRLR